MKQLRVFLLACLLPVAAFAAPASADTAGAFLADYEKIRAALADDNLAAAKAAAKALDGAGEVATAKSIGDARKAFKGLSLRAVELARDRPGWWRMHCPMYPGGADWVQPSGEVANPYWGKSMLRCGEIVAAPPAK